MKVPPPPPKRDAPQNEKGVSAEKDAQQRPRECKLLQLCNFDHYQITNYGLLVTSAPIKDFFAGRCAFQLNEDLFVYIMLAASPRKKPASPPRKRSSPNRRVESPRRPPDPSPRRRPDSPPIRRRPDPSPVRRGDTPPRRRPLSPLRRRSPSPPRRHMR